MCQHYDTYVTYVISHGTKIDVNNACGILIVDKRTPMDSEVRCGDCWLKVKVSEYVLTFDNHFCHTEANA